MNKAVLFIIFKRYETANRVFEVIRQAKPPRLYIAADGPRKNVKDEYEKCMNTRKIVEKVDWDCEVKTLFRDENLGCGLNVSGAINWLFEHEEDGIILEDDCLPDLTFFSFCEELLDYYKDNEKIMQISGWHFGEPYTNDSYLFFPGSYVWGWATWKRAWKYYDYTLEKYSYDLICSKLDKIYTKELKNANMRGYSKLICMDFKNPILRKYCDTWDYQFSFSMMANDGISIEPNYNLVSNIGSEDATHVAEDDERLNTKTYSINKIIHPKKIEVNLELVEKRFKRLKKDFTVEHYIDLIEDELYHNRNDLAYIKYNLSKFIDRLVWIIPIRSIRDNIRKKIQHKFGL